VTPRAAGAEWSRFYCAGDSGPADVLHARFVTHRYARHAHDHFVIALVECGAQSYSYRGARHITPAGKVFLVNPGEPHTGESATPAGYVYRAFYPRPEFLASVAGDVGGRAGVPFFREAVLDDPPLVDLLSQFHRSVAARASRGEREARLLEALARLITRHADAATSLMPVGRERAAVRRAREYLESRFADDPSLSELAALARLSPYHFARAFAREVGLPPHAYLEGVRIQRAVERLRRGESIAATALSVGYADQSHFTRRFKRFVGVTPGQYVREAGLRARSKIDQDKSTPECERDRHTQGGDRARRGAQAVRTA